ncbi:hypothetical protein [Vibrio sp. 10N.261.52.A1]|uniref:hypothetical protein n=1 Tax=Vibrio TaxID=662 RepID=UPI000C825371|nr:hypothetical protein [Vibrio sp. 10N.261.52.A1]PML35130.1 hypothetical protein BCT81_19090 [Vibrio sp. 10N.261.52.A1]
MNHVLTQESPIWGGIEIGTIVLNTDSLETVQSMRQQSQAVEDEYIEYLENSIISEGYNGAFPIVLNQNFQTVDGYSRLTASCNIVSRDATKEFRIPFIVGAAADVNGKAFNGATRGVMTNDLKRIFEGFPRKHGFQRGSVGRAVEQAQEATMFLFVREYGSQYNVETKVTQQQINSHIQKNGDLYREAFDAICHLANDIGYAPYDLKFAHWLALFVRHGINKRTVHVARGWPIENAGSHRHDRLAKFEELSAQATKGEL